MNAGRADRKHIPGRYIILSVLLLAGNAASAQSAKESSSFARFIRHFPVVSLPDTVRYTDAEFSYEYYTPEKDETDARKDTAYPYRSNVAAKPESKAIPGKLVKAFLMKASEPLSDMGTESDAVFYYSRRILTGKNFYCVIYEKQAMASGNLYGRKYLCTLDQHGRLIDKIKIASAEYAGTSIMENNFRIPWFPDEQSILLPELVIACFEQGLHYITATGSGTTRLDPDHLYRVSDKGKIIKVK